MFGVQSNGEGNLVQILFNWGPITLIRAGWVTHIDKPPAFQSFEFKAIHEIIIPVATDPTLRQVN